MTKNGTPPRAEQAAGKEKGAAAESAAEPDSMVSMRRINQILLAVALLALVAMLRKIDWPGLLHSFALVGAYWPLLFVPYGFACCFWTFSWKLLLAGEGRHLSVRRLFFLRLAGDSLNQLTPTASLGGEPFKAVRLKAAGVPWQRATTSLVIHKVLMVLSLVGYIFISLALVPVALPGLPQRLALFCSLGAGILGGAGVVFLVLQRRNPCVSLLKLLQRLSLCPAALSAREAELASLDATLAAFYRDHPGPILLAFFFFMLGWLAQSVEVYLIFRLLGHTVHFTVALCLDAFAQLVAGLGFMIPASLGVQDGGNVLLSLGFNLGATLGAGFSILRRFREAFWLLLGLLVLAWER